MSAEKIRWWMEVLRKNVYIQLVIAVAGILITGFSMLLIRGHPRGLCILYGLSLLGIGIISCYFSGVTYDRLNTKLRAAETVERQEKKKEEKNARKSKANKTDRT